MGTIVKLYYVDRNATYKEWELIPNKLLVVESIADYLATKSAYTINNFQYQKNALELGINVDLSQTYSQPNATTGFKYVSIQNDGENICYYFVKKVIWRSKSSVRFELVMDVLNTYQEGKDYEWKANTKITREHKDRYTFTKAISITIDMTNSTTYGSFAEGDEVILINDHGDTVFTGTIITIDSYQANIQIENPTSEEDYRQYINPFIEDPFEINKNGANYVLFTVQSENDFHFYTTYKHYRKIDFVPEGINPVLIQKSSNNIETSGVLNQNWYLLYRNTNNPDPNELVNPVECYLIPEESIPVSTGSISGGRLTASSLENNKYYFLKLQDIDNQITLPNGVSWNWTISGCMPFALVYKLSSGKLACFLGTIVNPTGLPDDNFIQFIDAYFDIEYITLNYLPQKYVKYSSADMSVADLHYDLSNATDYWDTDLEENYIDGINTLYRADAKNIKLIKLPYCPYKFTQSGGVLNIIDTDWNYETIQQADNSYMKILSLHNLNAKLQSDFSAASHNPFTNLKVNIVSIRDDDLRDMDEVDSKLFHSAFYSPTYVYDSFAFHVDLEKCELSHYIENGVSANKVVFNMTSTINSKFMFTFANYVCDKSESNFYNVLPIARNNEVVLYNVPYINFVKSGYNYEIKAKNLQNASNFIGLGLSGASLGAAMFVPTVPLKAAAVVGALVSMAMSIKSTITSAIQGEENIKQKLNQYSNQAASVMGSDDVDLMTEYCDNRLKYMVYEPTDVMKNLLNDLFFYAGYSSNRMGIPNHHTRLNFDYLECDASIQAVATIPEECLGELINCFKNGITYLHKTDRATDKWDFAQKYENWEITLMEG